MAKTPLRKHRLFRIYQERRTHGKKRFRYGFWPDFSFMNFHGEFVVADSHWVGDSQTTAIDLHQACRRMGYDLDRMVRPGFRFRNRQEAEQFYTVMILTLGV